ncbi:hypothetical protein JCM30760_22210 [Thiomicrorhabdus hydrogeniphila]
MQSLQSSSHLLSSRQGGFTLLELLMVVTILSSTAMVAMMTMDNPVSQHRIEDTKSRLALIEKATIQTMNYNNVNFDMGYVVDNGRLPPCIAGLLTKTDCDATTGATSEMQDYALLAPVYDPTPDADDFNNSSGDEEPLDSANQKLAKGFRSVYFAASVGNEFRDGWGNNSAVTAEDSNNFGWQRTETPEGEVTYTSFGRDNVDSATAAYVQEEPQDMDLSMAMEPSDWGHSKDVAMTINVTNNSGIDIKVNTGSLATDYTVVLLEFVNGEDRGYWRQTAATYEAVDPVNKIAISSGDTKSFTLTLNHNLAAGTHLLVLASKDASGLMRMADDYPRKDGKTDKLTYKMMVYSKNGVPNNTVNWEID